MLRSLHVLSAGVMAGAYILDRTALQQGPWVTATLASGAAILLLDLHESGGFLLQLRGWFIIAKLVAVALVPRLEPVTSAWVVAGLVVASVLSSHAPSSVRYRVLLGRTRPHGARTKG